MNYSWIKNILNSNLFITQTALASIVFCLSISLSFASEDQTPDHIGEISAEALLSNYPVFAEEYERFNPSAAQLLDIQALAGKEVVTLFGTWCHDSEREIPRLLKLLELGNVQLEQLTLVAVSRQKDDPEGYSKKFDLKYTPTIIINDQGNEIARIIEKPKGNLAQDIAKQIESIN